LSPSLETEAALWVFELRAHCSAGAAAAERSPESLPETEAVEPEVVRTVAVVVTEGSSCFRRLEQALTTISLDTQMNKVSRLKGQF
jgi:hypothetical protein